MEYTKVVLVSLTEVAQTVREKYGWDITDGFMKKYTPSNGDIVATYIEEPNVILPTWEKLMQVALQVECDCRPGETVLVGVSWLEA